MRGAAQRPESFHSAPLRLRSAAGFFVLGNPSGGARGAPSQSAPPCAVGRLGRPSSGPPLRPAAPRKIFPEASQALFVAPAGASRRSSVSAPVKRTEPALWILPPRIRLLLDGRRPPSDRDGRVLGRRTAKKENLPHQVDGEVFRYLQIRRFQAITRSRRSSLRCVRRGGSRRSTPCRDAPCRARRRRFRPRHRDPQWASSRCRSLRPWA